MPRLRQVPRSEVTDPLTLFMYDFVFGADRCPVESPGTETGTPGDWWTVFALDPAIMQHCVDGFAYYRGERLLDARLRELGQCRVGWARGSRFVFSQHCKSMRALGIDEEKISAIPSWQTADCFTAEERALLAYTDALVYEGGRVADGVFDALRAHFTDEQILEFTYITCMYDMHAVMSRALRTEFDDVPDRITEVEGDASSLAY